MKTATRFKIVGIEVIGLGAYLLLTLALQIRAAPANSSLESFSWDYGLVGILLVAVGLELLSLLKNVPGANKAGVKA